MGEWKEPFMGKKIDPREVDAEQQQNTRSSARREQRRAAFESAREEIRAELKAKNPAGNPSSHMIDKILTTDPKYRHLF